MRNFSIEMKRELKMNTQNTRSGMYLCVHFQRYLFAHVEDMREQRTDKNEKHLIQAQTEETCDQKW